MINHRIITSLLENDLYKFSMGQAIYHQFPSYITRWSFKCRNTNTVFTTEMIREIREQIQLYCTLRFNEDELRYLSNIPWITSDYIDFLRLWHPRFEDIIISEDPTIPCHLRIETIGTWLNTSMYEVPILAIVNEVYFSHFNPERLMSEFRGNCANKINKLCSGEIKLPKFSEFGLRRRLSLDAQDYIVELLAEKANNFFKSRFIGTSNVLLAKKYGLTPCGTMAHEWIMCVGQGNFKHNPAYSNYYALQAWVKEYGVRNGIALTDTITTDCFIKDFDLTFATLFSGVRHDSGDPIVWGYQMINHYKALGIDPTTKTLLFSDSLTFPKAHLIAEEFAGKADVAFGIGTYLSNDISSVSPLNIVMKVTECNGSDVAKISDTRGKGMCKNPDYEAYLQRTIDWRIKEGR